MRYVTAIGAEREGFVRSSIEEEPINAAALEHPMNGALQEIGELASDAGIGLFEAITLPAPSLMATIKRLKQIEDGMYPNDVIRTCYRPADWAGRGQWVESQRYDAIKEACRREAPDGWRKVLAMPDAASVHLNISGYFNPVGPDGLFIMNILNHVAPQIAAVAHDELGYGQGHLNMWRDFADPRRFTRYEDWFPDLYEFRQHFESINRFIVKQGDTFVPLPGTLQRLGDRLDHGVWWHFVRPKPGWYMEARLLPSMGDEQLEVYGQSLLSIVELLLVWFHKQFEGRIVHSLAEAAPAFEFVHQYHPDLFPREPLDLATWHALLKK